MAVEGRGGSLGSGAALKAAVAGLARNLALAAVYVGCGKFGLALAFIHANASAVWPPTGVALAALLVWGYRLWPGVFLGAFLVNITTAGSVATSLGIAGGNTCEALLGAWLVSRFAAGPKAFERIGTSFRFAFFAGVLSTTVSAAVGVTSLCLGGFASWSTYFGIWLTWWSGDMVSNLIVAPLLLIWFSQGIPRLSRKRLLEAIGLLVTVALVGVVVFEAGLPSGFESYPWTYLAFLPLLWAAFRFGEFGAVATAFLVDGIAIWGTLRGLGPFADHDPNRSLMFLQVFAGTVGLTAVVLALTVSERKRAGQLLAMECAISRQLEEAATLDEALKHILASVCSNLPGSLWDVAAFWTVDANARVLRCTQTWQAPWDGVEEFAAVSRGVVLAPGVSLPGRVWASGEHAWIPDLQRVATNCPRASYARKAGFHAGCGFPVRGGKECVGVIEVYSREIRPQDPELTRVFLAVGVQVGQFIERKTTEDRLALVIEGSSDGIWDWDLTANEVYFSSRWKSMLGYAENEVEHRLSAWERLLHPADRDRALASVQAYLEGATPSFELEHRLRHKDGSYRWILSRGVALRDATGKPVRMAGSHVDLTIRKQNEERLRRAYAELAENEAALKATVQKLQTAHEELQTAQLQLIQAAKLESVGTLAAGVAHEVKNPLQTILMGVYYLTNNLRGDNGNAVQVLTDMQDAVTRANAIIGEMLQLSAAANFDLRQTDLNPLVERSLRLIHNEVIASRTTVVRKLEAPLPQVRLDPRKMEQVFINLFLNALQAMSQGGTLRVATRHCHFGLDLELSGPAFAQFKPGDAVVVAEVQDTGKGIPEDVLAKVFDPFFTTKPVGVGTGLGLSVVKKIVDLQGGAIDIRNSPLGGVVVTLLLRAEPGTP